MDEGAPGLKIGRRVGHREKVIVGVGPVSYTHLDVYKRQVLDLQGVLRVHKQTLVLHLME